MQTQTMAMTPQLAMRPSRTLVAAMELLALPSLQLDELVEHELSTNPALERAERSLCSRCGAALDAPRCTACARERHDRVAPTPPELALQAEPTLAETLRAEVHLQLAERDWAIAEYLLGCLDEHGFVDAEVDEVAATLGVTRERVIGVLEVIQEAGPPGVGARDVRECLLLQLAGTSADPRLRDLAREIVTHRLGALGRGRYGAVARELDVERRDVLEARDLIRTRLRPYPTLPAPESWAHQAPVAPPEIVVREHGTRSETFTVELLEPRRLGLGISPSYEHVDGRRLASAERVQVEAQVTRARSFLDRLDRRWATIRAVAELVVERQHDFLVHGPRALAPLTRREAADALGFHESTVSRAVAGRHAMLPSRRVVALAAFFDAGAGPRDALVRAVATEPRPLTDAELAAELARAGFPIARRTIAKYRDQLGIPAQALR
jgi:RNA polymerase sigma-54 factor